MPLPLRKKAPAKRRAAPKKVARKPASKRTAPKKRVTSKTTIRQQNLGQQTESSVTLYHGKPDSRAPILKAVGMSNQYVYTSSNYISTAGINNRNAWAQTKIAKLGDLQTIGQILAPRNADDANQLPPARYLLESCEHNCKISNVGQANVRLQIMYVRAKRDLYQTMNYTSPDGFAYEWDGTPLTAVQQGVEAAASGPRVNGSRWYIPGIDATESPIFKSYFSVLKRTDVLLAVGGTHTLHNKMFYNRVLDGSIYGQNETMVGVMGVTDYLLFKAEGQTGIIAAFEGNPARVTTAQCQIALTENHDYKFLQIANSKSYLDTADPLTASTEVVNVISGSTGSGVQAVGLAP